MQGMSFDDDDREIRNCETCAKGKLARLPFNKSKSESKEILHLIHTDIVGPMETKSIGRCKYLITFLDCSVSFASAYAAPQAMRELVPMIRIEQTNII